MKRKWKSLSALCLAAVLVLSMPVSTMMAAEENTETAADVQKSDDDSMQDTVVDENPLLSEQISLILEDSVSTETQTEPIYTTSDVGSLPTLELKYQGMNLTQALDVAIGYDIYINNCDQCISISVSQGSLTSLSYYLDNSGSNESKSEEQLNSLWQSAENLSYQEVKMSQDGKYVLYVKAVAGNGQTACVRTVGLVVDSVRPVITGIQDGGTYPIGTKFGVEDANLAAVYVNEQEVSPSDDGQYQVAANGTSCVIRAKDMAGHETIYSITVSEEKPDDPENPDNPVNPDNPDNPDDPKPGDDITVINNSGSYSLHVGTAYRLGSGSWTLQGDSTVYRGGITFYVNTDGDYIFKKR